MAQGGTVEIEVELTGTKDIREGLGSIGEAGKSLVDSMNLSNDKLGEGIGELGESVFGLKDAFSELSTGIKSLGTTGASGLVGLLGPIGAVVTAGMALYEVFKLISGAALEAEQNESAMAAAASDLQSKLEALSEKGVVLAAKEMQNFSKMTILAQAAKEKLQFAQEKFTKQTQKAVEAQKHLSEVKKTIAKLEKEGAMSVHSLTFAREELKRATEELTTAEKELNASIKENLDEQKRVSKALVEAEKKYIEYEETSAEFLKTKIKENVETLKGLQLLESQINLTEDSLKLSAIQIEREAKLALVKAKKNEEDQKALLQQNKDLEKRIKAIDQAALAEELAVKNTEKVREEIDKKRKEEADKRRQRAQVMARQREVEAQKERQRQLKLFAEQTRIQQLLIEGEEDSVDKSIKLAELRYNTALSLAKENANQIQIAELTYQNELTRIYAQEDQLRLEEQKKIEEERRAFALETREFDIQQIEDSTQRELAMLEHKYDQQFELAKGNEERIAELQRRFTIERLRIMKNETSELGERFNSLFSNFGQGMADAAAGALVMGESFKASVVQVLQSLAKTAAVEGMMETAKGIAAGFFNPGQAASHFAAAAAFGAAAIAAGGAASALGGGGGGSGGGGGGVSPSGSPQTASTPMREEATTSTMVYNVNFSGAVVYDTKRAAEQALADRITRVMNQNRRGTPRR